MRKLAAAMALATALAGGAAASPQGAWPVEARGGQIPAPDWVLVIPARRGADGQVEPWPRDDAWTREWVVPRTTPSGTRTVALTGDSEDRRRVDGWKVDAMDEAMLAAIAEKYSAPAVAVAVVDGSGESAVAAWRPGHPASWDHGGYGTMAREGVLSALDGLFAEGAGGAGGWADIEIAGQRRGADGWMEYLVEAADEAFIDLLYSARGVEVTERPWNGGVPAAVVRVTDGRTIEAALEAAGLSVGY